MRDRGSLLERGGRITAFLGPTNTGKTHRAIQRMLSHNSGMIGLPLRLLAQEVYARIVSTRGADQVALVTGEQKRIPASPKWWVCTVEAMPVDRPVAFLAVDEIQLAGDRNRGHVFTDRLLNARGVLETVFLGSESIQPLLEELVPTCRVERLQRLSKLRFTGRSALGALPRRSAVVAFSAREVYALAERIRARHGGVAVVLGALSPRARNGQVALFETGEVDHIVATDAIGMGLNLDIDHVALAGLRKFDGQSFRALRAAELAQIAGRAGRYRRDGTFGTLGSAEDLDGDTVHSIETHRFPPLTRLFWRSSDLDFSSPSALLEHLDVRAPCRRLVPVHNAEDRQSFAALASSVALPSEDEVRLAWEIARIPDYRKTLTGAHVRLLERLLRHLMERGEIPSELLAKRLAALDVPEGDIDALTTRLAWVRTWAYVSQRGDWLRDGVHWQERCADLEERLSDALHESLTQRFVETRPSLAADGRVSGLSGELRGLRWIAASGSPPLPRGALRQAVLARVDELLDDLGELQVEDDLSITAHGSVVGRLARGRDVLHPELKLVSNPLLDAPRRALLRGTLERWLFALCDDLLSPLRGLDERLEREGRAVVHMLRQGLGHASARDCPRVGRGDRRLLSRRDVRFGLEHVYVARRLDAVELKSTLWAAWNQRPRPSLEDGDDAFLRAVGYRRIGSECLRVDVLETRAAATRRKRRSRRASSRHK